jgi:type III secretion protein N (ATPase)
MRAQAEFDRLAEVVRRTSTRVPSGKLVAVTGPLVRAHLPGAEIGELCELRQPEGTNVRLAEVVAIDGDIASLAPYGSAAGLSARTDVVALGRRPGLVVGRHLLGRVVDAFGRPLEGLPGQEAPVEARMCPLSASPPAVVGRPSIDTPFLVGIRAIDGLLTCGEGQRIGVFGSAGGGKSTLVSQIVSRARADIVVVALVGERGREVGDFVRHVTDAQGRSRSIVVVSTSDRPPIERVQAALAATACAEYFRDLGLRVLLVVDSVTRLARALRDVGLAAGEPPARRGFPPSVFSFLPQLFERAGMAARGSITAFYTVLIEGDPAVDPIVEETKSLLDGHIMLSPRLAAAGHFPAIDVLESRSRLMEQVVGPDHRSAASKLRELMARHADIELLIQVGEFERGTDALSDEAVDKIERIRGLLRQEPDEVVDFDDTIARMKVLAS